MMTTIHPEGLASLLSHHVPVDLIDVRPKEQFDRLHILGARSALLTKMSAAKVLHERKSPYSSPLFVVSDDRISAGMAAGMLRSAGCDLPVVVEGGMRVWEAQGLPAVHKRRFHW